MEVLVRRYEEVLGGSYEEVVTRRGVAGMAATRGRRQTPWGKRSQAADKRQLASHLRHGGNSWPQAWRQHCGCQAGLRLPSSNNSRGHTSWCDSQKMRQTMPCALREHPVVRKPWLECGNSALHTQTDCPCASGLEKGLKPLLKSRQLKPQTTDR